MIPDPPRPPDFRCTLTPAEIQRIRTQALIRGAQLMREWWRHRKQMRQLKALEQRLLDDIGITREAAELEAARSFRKTYARRHMK